MNKRIKNRKNTNYLQKKDTKNTKLRCVMLSVVTVSILHVMAIHFHAHRCSCSTKILVTKFNFDPITPQGGEVANALGKGVAHLP